MTEADDYFVDPTTVLSPKGSVANLRVLRNTGAGGYAVASMTWDGEPRLGIRWNGGSGNPIGNPQSRGIATWFVLPPELSAAVRAAIGASGGALDLNTPITRVRVRPLPIRIRKGEHEQPMDDEWVLSVTDRTQGHLEIVNPRTGHFMAVDQSHIQGLAHDTVSDKPGGPKHGILTLNVQMVFEDGRLSLEPASSLLERIDQLTIELHRTGYAGKRERVIELINEARAELTQQKGRLGPWEAECLDYAFVAVTSNFLRLALTSVAKAIAVSNLPTDDYDFGFNYPKRGNAPRSVI